MNETGDVGFKGDRFQSAFQQLQTWGLSPEPLPFSLNIHPFETLSSTNRTLWELIDQGAPAGTVVIAETQTSGRGQWGRQWQSGKGGLYLSLSLEPYFSTEQSLLLTLASAWGIATILRQLSSSPSEPPLLPVQIKWPNDLILSGKKLGGILTETRFRQGQISKAIIGVGINWINPVPSPGINLQTFMSSLTDPPITSLEMLTAVTLQGLISGYQQAVLKGIEGWLSRYEHLLVNLNQTILVNGQPGLVVGVTERGQLRVRFPSTNSASPVEMGLDPGTISLGYSNIKQ